MPNNKLHNDLKQLSAYVYRDGNTEKPAGWISIKSEQDKKTGFYAESFYKDGQVAVVYRGSDDTADWLKNNREMGLDIEPAQKVDAEKFYQETKDAFPNQAIVVTGHSLGGSLAQIVGSETGAQTVTFNAYGTGGIIQNPTYTDNITNYGNQNDPIFRSNVDNQIGNTYLTNVPDGKGNGDLIAQKDGNYNKDLNFDNHNLDKMGDLSNSVEYNKNTPLGTSVMKASAKVNVDKNGNRIYTREEIGEMTPEEYQKNESTIMNQLKESGIPTKAQADSNTKSNSSNSSKPSNASSSGDGNWVTINGNHVLLD